MTERTCSIDGCGLPHHSRGMCKSHYRRDYYVRNRKHERSTNRKWMRENRDLVSERNKRYAEENREALAVKRREYYEENRDELLARRAETRDPDADDRWRAANPERWAERNRANTRRRNRGGLITAAMVIEWYGTTCHVCGEEIDLDEINVDHVIPLGKGGPNKRWNVRPAHAACNLRKGTRLLIDGQFVRATDDAIAEVTRRLRG